MLKFALPVLVGLCLSSQSFAQDVVQAPVRTITVNGTASISLTPDYASVDFGAYSKSSSAAVAKRESDAKMTRIVAAVKKLGVKEADIQTSGYSLIPTRAKDDAPIIWKVQQSVTVKVRKLSVVAQVIDSAVQSGATNVDNIAFALNEYGSGRAKVREQAVNAAKEKARTLAKLLGVELGDVQSAIEQGDNMLYRAQWMTNSYAGGMSSDSNLTISPGQIQVSLTVNVVYGIK